MSDDIAVVETRAGRPRKADPPDLVDRVRALAAAGHTDTAIGQELGMPRTTVASLRHRNGIPAAWPPGRPGRRWHHDTIAKVRAMAAAGHTDAQIGEAVGLARETVCWLRHRNSIPAGRPRRGRPTTRT